MLLSIDKVLQLLAEGKDVGKIEELSGAAHEEIVCLIEEARTLLAKHEKERSRKKLILKRKIHVPTGDNRIPVEDSGEDLPSFLGGAELTAVPVEDLLIINIAAVERNGVTGIALLIHDREDRQVGKLSYCLRRVPARRALIRAAIRSWEIAEYFRASGVKIRSNDDIFVRQINGEIYVQEQELKDQYEAFQTLVASGKRHCKCEPYPTLSNDKTTYLAEKAIPVRA
jgi:hypothetical protein